MALKVKNFLFATCREQFYYYRKNWQGWREKRMTLSQEGSVSQLY